MWNTPAIVYSLDDNIVLNQKERIMLKSNEKRSVWVNDGKYTHLFSLNSNTIIIIYSLDEKLLSEKNKKDLS